MSQSVIRLGPFRFDRQNYCLQQGTDVVNLTPKVFAVLDALAARRGEIVTKDELLDTVWADEAVGDAVLKTVIREIRRLLDDNPKSPRFIQTAHRRGYRLLPEDTEEAADSQPSADRAVTVGRAQDLDKLLRWFEQTQQHGPRTVLVSGEAGIGKSTLIDLFTTAASNEGAGVIHGHCIEHYGPGEAYLPVLDAIGRLIQGPDRSRVVRVLRQFAPTWFAQLPALAAEIDAEVLRKDVIGATHERMLREMVEALEALAEESPLILVLEDLQWSDYSTLDLLSWLTRRGGRSRLLVLGSYRPVEVIVSDHPLRAVLAELRAHPRYHELPVEFLGVEEVGEFVKRRLAGQSYPDELPSVLHRRTAGNPLFLVNVIAELLTPGNTLSGSIGDAPLDPSLVEQNVPESIRALLERRLTRLDAATLELLEGAAICGFELDLRVMARAAETDPEAAESLCDKLVRRHGILEYRKPRADATGGVTPCYQFQHSLIRSVIADRLSPARRARLHQRVGRILEELHEGHTSELAAELALHFSECHDTPRAVEYSMRAARNATARQANREALDHLTKAAQLARLLPTDQRTRALMDALEARGLVLRSMGDMRGSAEEFDALATTAREYGVADREIHALIYRASSLFWVSRERCLEVVDTAVAASRRLADPVLLAHARGSRGHWNLNLRGWSDEDADACRQSVEAAEAAGDRALLRQHCVRLIYVDLLAGNYEAADRNSEHAIRLAFEQDDAYDYLLAHFFRGWALLHSGRWGELLAVLDHAIRVATSNGHELWSQLLHLLQAQLHCEAQDFTGALEIAKPVVEHAHGTVEPIGQLFFHGTIVMGLAELGRGEPELAERHLSTVESSVRARRFEVDCMLHYPLWWGLAESRLLSEDWAGADSWARELVTLAARSGEPTYRVLGLGLLSELAHRIEPEGEAERALSEALGAVDAAHPVAAWKTLARGADILTARSRPREAAACRERALKVLDPLAQSLTGTPLHSHFTTSEVYRELTNGA